MKIDVISDNTLKITLSVLDMSELDISCDSFGAKTAGSKATLARLLRLAEHRLSFRFPTGAEKLYVEAFPRFDGGCMLYISSPVGESDGKGAARGEKTELLPLICRTDSFELLARLCACLYGLCKSRRIKTESGAYTDGHGYRLVIRAENRFAAPLEHCMSEFGEILTDRLDYAATLEHFRALCENDALERLSALA